ncbi:MAG: LCP family protein [bacterium]|nr:LCP family protein [bacterium]
MSWIGRKSYTLIDDNKPIGNGPLRSKPKRKLWKYIVLAFFLIILGIGSWIGYSGWQAVKNITSGSDKKISFFKFLGGNNKEKLNGENSNRINILLVGIGGKNHPGGTLADTIMMLSIDPKNKRMGFLSIPRDFYAKLPDGSYGKINAVHSLSEGKKTGSGPVALAKSVSEITGQPVKYYIRGDFTGFKQIVDTLGGVTVDVPKAIYDPYYPDERMVGFAPFRVKKGIQTMNGTTALKYARSRETTSDFDRAKRQQQLLVAIKEKAMNLGILANPKKLVALINAVGDHAYTNFNPDELIRLIELAKNTDSSKIRQIVLSTDTGGALVSFNSRATGYVLKPKTGDYSQIRQIAKNMLSDQSTLIAQSENSTIEVQNATGQSGTATEVSAVLNNYGYKTNPYLQILSPVSETVLYDYSTGTKKQTAQFLVNKFAARKIEKKPTEGITTDFTLILGTDYLDLLRSNR